MTKIIIIGKSGECKDVNIKSVNINEICKKCSFRKLDNFEKRVSWKIKHKSNSLIIAVYAKNNGRATTENKFDMPPPIDNELYFGSVAVVAYKEKISETASIDFSVDDWCKTYEKLMGGFIDLSKESEEESEEEVPEEELSKEGYHKDGFIVDSEEELELEEEIENIKNEEEQEEEGEEGSSFVSEEETYDEYSEHSQDSEVETEEELQEEKNTGSELEEEEYLTE
jgi:hypothetical protein